MKWNIEQVKHELCGPCALVMAPFNRDQDLSLNLEALEKNINYIMAGGLKTGRGFIICPCGTGEYLALSPEEHRLMVETAVEITGGKLAVVAGVAGIDIRQVIQMARNAEKAGAKYAMIPPPFYDVIDQDGIYNWYRILSEALDLGVMVYDQSWRTLGTGLELPLIERLSGLQNIVSLKYGNPTYLQEMVVALEQFSDRFAFVDNSLAYTAVTSHIHGGTGFISGPAAWWPEFELKFFQLMQEGKYAEADRWHARLAPYMAMFQGEFWTDKKRRAFHGADIVKASMEYVGLYGGPLRPPFRELSQEEKRELWSLLDQMGVTKAN